MSPLGHASPDLLEAAQASAQLDLAEALAVLDPVLTDPGVLKLGLDIKQTLRLLSTHGPNARPGRRLRCWPPGCSTAACMAMLSRT